MDWKNLRKKREALGVTQDELSAAVGILHQAVSKYENGIAVPDPEHEKKNN